MRARMTSPSDESGAKSDQRPSFQQRSTIVDDIIEAARSMVENDGVRAVCSACGFFGNYQQQVRRALDVPVAMSSLVQIPGLSR